MATDQVQVVKEVPRRQEILQATIELFSAKGYHGTSMEEIARAVGVKKPALYYYFPGKQDLLFASLDEFTQRMAEDMEKIYASSASSTERLRQAFYYHVNSIAAYQSEFTVLLSEFKYLKARRKRQINARRDRYENMIRKIIDDGMSSGEFRPAHPKFAAFSLLAIANWICQWYRPGQLQPDEIADHFWDLYMKGLGAQ